MEHRSMELRVISGELQLFLLFKNSYFDFDFFSFLFANLI